MRSLASIHSIRREILPKNLTPDIVPCVFNASVSLGQNNASIMYVLSGCFACTHAANPIHLTSQSPFM